MKRILLILFITLFCVSCYEEGFTVEETVEIDGLMNLPNAIHDTLIDETMKGLGTGASSLGALDYIWIYHVEYLASAVSSWEQLTTTDKAGGADTVNYFTQNAIYTADVGIVYDSVLRERWTYAGFFTDSPTVWYASQTDTQVLASGDQLDIDWTLTANAGGSILDTLEWHMGDLWQNGTCDDIDSVQLIYNNGDTNSLYALVYFDYVNDTLYAEVTDTQRSAANDSVLFARLVDDDGAVLSNATVNGLVANPSTPKLTYKLKFVEN